MIRIDAKTPDAELQNIFNRLLSRMGNLTPVMSDVGEYLAETTKERFATSTAPDGAKWEPNTPVTVGQFLGKYSGSYTKKGAISKRGKDRAAGKKPLIGETKSLSTTIAHHAARTSASVISDEVYSAVQQAGAKKGQFGKTKRGAPIPWGDIPAREFIGMSDHDWSVVRDVAGDFLAGS